MQVSQQEPRQDRRHLARNPTGKGGRQPGQSGNPAGRESAASRRARIAAMVEQWVAELGGKVGAAERILLTRAAELTVMRHPRQAEQAVRVANSISKLLAQAGFH